MTNAPLEVGITGGIGSGKSIVCKMFSLLGVPIYDADSKARWLMNHNPDLRAKIIHVFGPLSYHDTGLNRDYIAHQVFDDPEKLKLLNSLVHPKVGEDYDQWVKLHITDQLVIKEAALMFESDSHKRLAVIITVSAPETTRIKRVLQRDPFRKESEIKNIINRQLSEEERNKRADYIIVNDNTQMLIPQVLALYNRLTKS